MCLGIPGEVVAAVPDNDQLALVDVLGVQREVNVGMPEEPPAAGQWVLIHAGFALQTGSAPEAEAALEGLRMAGRGDSPL
jgi:hydrogenase assembly chaperone HypC/HupF